MYQCPDFLNLESLRDTGKEYFAMLASELAVLNQKLGFKAVQQLVQPKTSKYRELFKRNVYHCNISVDRKKKIYRWFARKLDRIEDEARLGERDRFWQYLAAFIGGTVAVVDFINSCWVLRLISGTSVIGISAVAASAITGIVGGILVFAIFKGIQYVYNTDAVQDMLITRGWKPAVNGEQHFDNGKCIKCK